MEEGDIDAGNAKYEQEALIILDKVLFHGREFSCRYVASMLVEDLLVIIDSYVCKTGLGDVLIGA